MGGPGRLGPATLLLCLLWPSCPAMLAAWLRRRACRAAGCAGPAGPDAPEPAGDAVRRPRARRCPSARPRRCASPPAPDPPAAARHRRRHGRRDVARRPPARPRSQSGASWRSGSCCPRARAVATVGAVGFIVAGALNVDPRPAVHHYAPGSDWAGAFVHAGNLVWIGMALLLADGVIAAFGLRTKRLPRPAAWGPWGGQAW